MIGENMKFCKYCGRQLDENAIFCSSCGARTNDDNPGASSGARGYGSFYEPVNFGYDTRESTGVAILSFFFWQVGLVLWFFWRHTRPGKARSAVKGAVASAGLNLPIVGLVVWLLWKDTDNRDIAKIAGISAIVGAVFYALIVALAVILTATGTIDESIIDYAYALMVM